LTAVIYQLRDYQNPKDLERLQKELEQQAADVLSASLLSGGVDVLYESSLGFIDKEPA
jgi:hypothetical protein